MRLIAVGLWSFLAFAQAPTTHGGGRLIGVGMGFSGTAYAQPPITGAPYSAEQVNEQMQTLADGTHINQKPRTTLLYRDSQGRTRTERPIGPPDAAVSVVEIYDGVAGFRYVLDPEKKVAHRTALTQFPRGVRTARGASGATFAPPPPPPPPPAVPGTAPPVNGSSVSFSSVTSNSDPATRPQHSSEQLGTQTMEGVTVEGRRETTVFPVGSQGNDQPITTVTEIWSSAQLRQAILIKMMDPRTGVTTTRMQNVVMAEPDPNLFVPPPDYTITDETGNFQLHFSR